jgi:phospholipase C
MQQAGVSWRIYSGVKPTSGGKAQYDNYIFDICTYFADCLYTAQANNQYPSGQVIADATNGTLPEMSMVFPTKGPTGATSQHNGTSMLEGDNWIGQVVGAIENGPDWDSTAIFITYDDCGCFYDHVSPPPGYGIRVPMVIVSPWAKPGYTDSNTASFASVIAFAEHTFNFGPVTAEDAGAYDFSNAFDYSQSPLPPVRMTVDPLPLRERAWLKAHPPAPDPT